MAQLHVTPETYVRTHNATGCDLCNRTGIQGRTLLLDAIVNDLPAGARNSIYEALMSNVNAIIGQKGVILHTRREGLIDLVTSGLVDPKSALTYLED